MVATVGRQQSTTTTMAREVVAKPTAISSRLLSNVDTQSQLLTQLFASIANPAAVAPVPRSYAALASTTDELAGLLEEARQHQLAHQAMQKQKAEVFALERKVRSMLVTLETGRGELQSLVDQGRETAAVMERAAAAPLATDRLLAHAQALAPYTSAPVSTLLGAVPLAFPPYPSEAEMRSGRMHREGQVMGRYGDYQPVAGLPVQAPSPSRFAQPQAPVIEADPAAQAEAAAHAQQHQRKVDTSKVWDLDLNSDMSDSD